MEMLFGGDVSLLARAGVSLQQESWSCGYLAQRAAEHLIVNVLRWTCRPITFTVYFLMGVVGVRVWVWVGGPWAPTPPSPNTFYRPFTRWTRDMNPPGWGSIPPGVPGYLGIVVLLHPHISAAA